MKSDLRIAFFGTPQFSVDVLDALKEAGIVPSFIVTAPDTPRGRNLILTPPEAKVWGMSHDIEVIQPASLKLSPAEDGARDVLYNSEWDLFLVASYGKILPKALLDLPTHGTLNVHPSLLPLLRGASPVRSAILNDTREAVGVSIMLLDEGLDTGPIVAQGRIEVEDWPPHATVLERLLAHEGGKLLAEVIPTWLKGEVTPEPQDAANATHSKKITKDMGELDLAGNPYQNFLKIRALEGWPGTYFFVERGGKRIRVKIADASYEDNTLTILRVVPEGKKEMDYQDFLRSLPA